VTLSSALKYDPSSKYHPLQAVQQSTLYENDQNNNYKDTASEGGDVGDDGEGQAQSLDQVLQLYTDDAGKKRVSSFNGCRCVQDTRTVDEKSELKGAVLFLEGRWRDGPVKKTTKIPRKYPRRLGVVWIKVSFQPPSDAFYAANGLRPPESMSLVQHHQPVASTPDNYDSAGLGGWGHTILPAGAYLPAFGKLVVQLPSDLSVDGKKAPIEVQSCTPSAGEKKAEPNNTPCLMGDPRESFLYCALG